MNMIKVVVVEPNKEPYTKEIENTLGAIQLEVDGYMQAVPYNEQFVFLMDEDGKLKNKYPNRYLGTQNADFVAGKMLVVKTEGEDFVSMSDEEPEHWVRYWNLKETQSEQMLKPKFKLGKGVMTNGVQRMIENGEITIATVMGILNRHGQCDWGDLPECDLEANNEDLHNMGRLLSKYKLADAYAYIITEGDRSSTTVLLVEEY